MWSVNNGTIEFAGTEQQEICLVEASIVEISNTSKEGVIFTSYISVTKLFDHKGNNFTLYNNGSGSTFVDYDGDGLFDNVDPHPTIQESECELRFSAASLTLYDNLELNYLVDRKLFEQVGYVQPYIEFVFNSEVTYVSEYTIRGDYYVFNFSDISPNKMIDTVYATLYAMHRGVLYHTDTSEYSVTTYCYNTLSNYSGDEYAELRTLLVDLLNYGAQTQIYTNYKTGSLANASLTDAQKVWGTTERPEVNTVFNKTHAVIDTPSVQWLGAGLNLQDSITLRFKIAADDIKGLKVKVAGAVGTWWIDNSLFEVANDGYYIYFSCLNASELKETLYLTVYKGNTIVSNTICYSIESYVYSKQSTDDQKLYNLLETMMKYGNSAYAYVH